MRSKAAAGGRGLRTVFLLALLSVAARAGPSDIQVKDAWIRWLPADLPGGGYVTLTNTGAAAQVLIGASSPDYGEVSLHQTGDNHGMNEMTPIASLLLKPHSSVRFEEGGYHFMLMRPQRPLHPGDKVAVTLRFGGGQTITTWFDVRGGNETAAPAS
jgi:copper(I)-binding protein